MSAIIAVGYSLAWPAAADETASVEHVSDDSIAPTFRLHGALQTFDIVMVKWYPFIAGRINGVDGKLMLDIGGNEALVLNDHRIPLGGGRLLGREYFGSGQSYSSYLRPSIASVQIGAHLEYKDVSNVKSQDATQLEHITPDFLGWIGFDFWRGYSMKLDYRNKTVTFYRSGSMRAGDEPYLKGEHVFATVPFEIRKLPNDPVIHVDLGSAGFDAVLDTGQYGEAWMPKATEDRLIQDGVLKPSGVDEDGLSYELADLRLTGGITVFVPGVHVHNTPWIAARSMGIDGWDTITLGYGLLRQYKTVWDFAEKKLFLMRP